MSKTVTIFAAIVFNLATSAIYAGGRWNTCASSMSVNPQIYPAPLRNRVLPNQVYKNTRLGLHGKSFSLTAENPDFLLSLTSEAEFSALARLQRLNGHQLRVVKILYDRNPETGGPKVYFINTSRFPFHYEFALNSLQYRQSGDVFNRNYSGSGEHRALNLGSLVLDQSSTSPRILMELWTGDQLTAPFISELYAAVTAKITYTNNLFFHPLSVDQESTAVQLNIPTIRNSELKLNQKYQALNEGEALGFLKFIDPLDETPLLEMNQIAVFRSAPNDIGLAGGVITEEKQTPLSHINVKSTNRGTPNMSLSDAFEKLSRFHSKPVRLKVNANNFEIEELNPDTADAEIAAFWDRRRPRIKKQPLPYLNPKFDGTLVNLSSYYTHFPSSHMHRALVSTVGAKAANLALINHVVRGFPAYMGVTSPATMSAPFNFYDLFMKSTLKSNSSTLEQTVFALLKRGRLLQKSIVTNSPETRRILQEVRQLILNTAVPDEIIAEFKRNIWTDRSSPLHITRHPILLLRSSTNSEDLEGFTGAGLYNSARIELYRLSGANLEVRSWHEIEEELRKKIPFIYASVWNERAFFEREWFGLDHKIIKAAIAVHGGFAGTLTEGPLEELANGVAISRNFYNETQVESIYINAQHLDISVTNPPTTEELEAVGEFSTSKYNSEEISVTTMLPTYELDRSPSAWRFWPYERLQLSSLRQESPVLQSGDEIRRLAWAVRQIRNALAKVNLKHQETYTVDVEWNIFGEKRVISINQARPYVVNQPSP